jgi:DNA polymerase III delta prime subunit
VGRKLLDILKAENIKFDRNSEEFRNGFKLLVKEVKGDLRLAVNMLEQLITENKEINVKNILALRKPVLAADALKLALQGDINKAREMMEDALVLQNNSADVILEDLTKAIGEVEDQEIRARLYIRLAEVERNLKLGTNPVLQFIAFLSYAWILPHLPRGG